MVVFRVDDDRVDGVKRKAVRFYAVAETFYSRYVSPLHAVCQLRKSNSHYILRRHASLIRFNPN